MLWDEKKTFVDQHTALLLVFVSSFLVYNNVWDSCGKSFFVHQMYNALTGYVHIAITADRLGKALYCLPCTDNKFGSFVLRYAVLFR
ncbi:hypothetical protein M097_2269 [Phocaeicola vulgatus str. 3775 SL(B) 10 (iv)]|uniref:Uncharacterized protein n=1 Tax=Phocaeicola vulgatus str. 3775 SL(B) 10 (iv) TaxID=1339350 RepID=A0A078R8V9_PHOVU|nr:hypothetical protein M097_2269 [Phocaeicola vulgatus str. 3775 SL(B) 10 (iv)]